MADTLPGFQRTQFEFAAYIRDPHRHPVPPGVAPVRMDTYRELFFNNIESFIATGFPVLKSILVGERWLALVQDFYARHRCKTPLFVQIAEEFLAYLQAERGDRPEDPAFLLELAHYEWVELALAVGEAEVPQPDAALIADPLPHTIRLSELAWPLAYHFPVHKIGPDFQPAEPPGQPTFLLVYRDCEDVVRFMELNPVTYRLLELLEASGPLPARDCLSRIAEELRHPDPGAVVGFGAEILRGLAERGVIGVAVS
ncbi:HvfC family RiPP maturation protein [Methylomagnum sp.]